MSIFAFCVTMEIWLVPAILMPETLPPVSVLFLNIGTRLEVWKVFRTILRVMIAELIQQLSL